MLHIEVRAALERGDKLHAIKLLREKTGLSLAEAKALIEGGGADAPEGAPAAPAGLPADVVAAMRDGRKIDAIRLLRERRRIGLKEAKEAVEAHALEQGLAPGEVPRTRAGGWLVAIAIVLAGLVWLYNR